MKTTLFTLLVAICLSVACATTATKQSPATIDSFISMNEKPLTGEQIKKLVSGNSMVGVTHHSKSLYELYFDPNGEVIFRKGNDNKQVHKGKWWVKDDMIFSTWPTYNDKINQLRYYHLMDDSYAVYNVTDSCGPAGTFCHPFLVVHGRLKSL